MGLILTIAIIAGLFWGFICRFVAIEKGRDPINWFLGGLFLGLLGLIILAIIPKIDKQNN